MNLGDRFRLTLFTNRPALALAADRAGVDRIGPDLERLGKLERQRGMSTWISDHIEADLPAVYAALERSLASGGPAVVHVDVDPVKHMWAPGLMHFKDMHQEPKGK